jgi:hypothetical protein
LVGSPLLLTATSRCDSVLSALMKRIVANHVLVAAS